MTPEDSAAMERIIQLARRLAKHPSILNAISLTLRYKWSDDAAGSQMKLHERASEEELQKGLQAINDIWPTIIADEEYVGAHSRETDMLHKVFIAFEVCAFTFY
jgi:hypothetical protein